VRTKPFILLLGLALVFVAAPAEANLTFVLTPAVQSGARSNEVFFTGTLSNTSQTDTLFLNDIEVGFTDAGTNYLTADTNTFFANVPGILLPGETYSDIVFAVAIDPAAPPGDYFGSVTIMGGSNIFAADNLGSQSFQVSSPAVSISATVTDAFEFGALPGAFVISRVGATNIDLTVNYVIGGTASNGVDYSSISNSIVIPPGTTSAAIAIVPLTDNAVDGDETVVLTLSGTSTYNLSASVSATVTIHDTPFNMWRLAEFGTNANNSAISGDFADPDGDGIANLLEYALHLNPNVVDTAGLPTPQIDPACGCLTLIYTKVISAIDLAYTAEAASDPGGPWSTNGITTAVIADNGVTQAIEASDAGNPFAATIQRFMHLRVTRLP
jgi:hypothetical protein